MLLLKAGSSSVAFRNTRPARSVAPQPAVAPTFNNVMSGLSVGCRTDEAGVTVAAPGAGMKWTMMRHGDKVKHLGRPADQRKALIRSLVTELLRHGQIRTTKVKAKVIRSYVDKMITLAKNGSLHARRQALAFVYDKELVANVFDAAPERFGDRNGGYTRIKPEVYLRRGDATEMAIIELL
eukprot:GHRQ01001728.1.p1 GENE.GHRQ01001728.1~~GHRQ01001728.1.p1  ORF type:complete len:181 (+),score=67.19 GHRQ01001728.1:123-665(+)